jgi:hypothetical protein
MIENEEKDFLLLNLIKINHTLISFSTPLDTIVCKRDEYRT